MTDSAASLPLGVAERLGIVIVPMTLVLGGIVYADGDLPVTELMSRLDTESVSTASPSPGDYIKSLEQAGSPKGDVLVLTVSSAMSSTFDVAQTARSYLGPGSVRVLDTGTAAGAQGLVVLAAAEHASTGARLEDVAATAEQVVSRVRLLATLEDLDYLARSGRVPGIAARASRSLRVRAVFEFSRGNVKPRRPALSTGSAIERIVDACSQAPSPNARLHAALLHAQAEGVAGQMQAQIRSSVPGAITFLAPFSSVMVAHTGPGLVGAAWWWEDNAGLHAGALRPRDRGVTEGRT